MNYTEEQKKAIDFVKESDEGLIINAFAGTGKTSTLVGIVEANPNTRFLYLAFNRAVKKEADSKFPSNCKVYTLHGLAYQMHARGYFGKNLQPRLKNKWKNRDYVEFLEVENGVNRANFICFAARSMVRRFKNSGDFSIQQKHVDPEHVLRLQNKDGQKVLELAKLIWALENDPEEREFPIDHDTYLKSFQLSRPQIDLCDILLLDEAQDTNPVAQSIINDFNSRIVLVGDSFQSIYQWRGAVNSMEDMKDKYHTLWLTKSFRFGDEIANLGSEIIKMLEPEAPTLVGNEEVSSEISSIQNKKYTMLFRTNAELARKALNLIGNGKDVYVEGGVKDLCDDLTDLYALSKNQRKTGKSAKYRVFNNYSEVLEEAEHMIEIKKDLKLLEDLGDELPSAVALLKSSVKDKRSIKKVDMILSTAHKSKGLEWDHVKLHDDFNFTTTKDTEWNLIYVAVTRAKRVLEIPKDLKLGMEYYKKQKQGFESTEEGKALNEVILRKAGEK